MRAIVIGAGGATRELLRRVGEFWDVAVVDTDRERLAVAAQIRNVETVVGDGSSRVVLDQAKLADADAVVAATNDDTVNIEACRLALQAGIPRVIALAADPERLGEYRDMNVPVYSPGRLAARRMEITLEPRVTSAAFADGLAEAIEVRIGPESPVVGRPLLELSSEAWLVAAILRDGALVIPHGRTVLQSGDLVTVVGAAADYSTILRSFTAGEARFPIEWGKQVAVALTGDQDLVAVVPAAVHLTRNSAAQSLIVVHQDLDQIRDEAHRASLGALLGRVAELAEGLEVRTRAVRRSPLRALLRESPTESIGVIAISAPGHDRLLGRTRMVRLMRRLRATGRPVLIVRAPSYGEVVVPLRESAASQMAVRAAIDLAARARAGLVAVAPVAAVSASADAKQEALRAAERLGNEAALSGVSVRHLVRRGPLVRLVEEVATPGSLVVLSQPRLNPTFLQPGTAGQIVRRVPSSVLILPEAPTP